MKAQNNTQTKVNSRITIVVLYISTVVFSLAVIGLTASAQEIWNQYSNYSSYGKMTSVLVGYPSETAPADAAFEVIDAEIALQLNHSNPSLVDETEMEETFAVEHWMTNEANFISTVGFNALETEETLEVEPWMTSEEIFNSVEVLATEEPVLEVETWMTDPALFNSPFSLIEAEKDKPLNVEEWMTSELNFNNLATLIASGSETELALETWMLNEDYFKPGESLMAKVTKQNGSR